MRALGDVGFDAAAGDRAEHAPGARDRELRADRARGAPPRRDDRRERDRLAGCAPFLCLRQHVVHMAMMLAMSRLDDVLAQVDAGSLGDPLPVLAYLAGQAVVIDEAELNGARRRALLLVAAGGDVRRELEVDDRAVKSLATDLYNEERREQLARSVDALVARVRDLPVAREGALFLAADIALAWRLFALALLAEELAE